MLSASFKINLSIYYLPNKIALMLTFITLRGSVELNEANLAFIDQSQSQNKVPMAND